MTIFLILLRGGGVWRSERWRVASSCAGDMQLQLAVCESSSPNKSYSDEFSCCAVCLCNSVHCTFRTRADDGPNELASRRH